MTTLLLFFENEPMKRRLVRPLSSAPAVVLLFVPFTWGESPYSALEGPDRAGLWFIASPFFLSVPILVLQLQFLVRRRVTRAENVAYHLLALAVLATTVYPHADSFVYGRSDILWLAMLALLVALAFRTILLNSRRRNPEAPLMALMAGWIPNAVSCGIGFWGEWQLGAYLAAFTLVVFVFEIARAEKVWQHTGAPAA